jgi:hypothetical protein
MLLHLARPPFCGKASYQNAKIILSLSFDGNLILGATTIVLEATSKD